MASKEERYTITPWNGGSLVDFMIARLNTIEGEIDGVPYRYIGHADLADDEDFVIIALLDPDTETGAVSVTIPFDSITRFGPYEAE